MTRNANSVSKHAWTSSTLRFDIMALVIPRLIATRIMEFVNTEPSAILSMLTIIPVFVKTVLKNIHPFVVTMELRTRICANLERILAKKSPRQSRFARGLAVSLLFLKIFYWSNYLLVFLDGCEKINCRFYSVCQKGKCICPQHCETASQDPICGSDLVTYSNECALRAKACQIQKYIIPIKHGPCTTCKDVQCDYGARCEDGACVCPRKCPHHYDPVCGSNNITYDNQCKIMAASCESTTKIIVKHKGQCERTLSQYTENIPDISRSSHGDSERDHLDQSKLSERLCDYNICKYSGTCVLDQKDQPQCFCK